MCKYINNLQSTTTQQRIISLMVREPQSAPKILTATIISYLKHRKYHSPSPNTFVKYYKFVSYIPEFRFAANVITYNHKYLVITLQKKWLRTTIVSYSKLFTLAVEVKNSFFSYLLCLVSSACETERRILVSLFRHLD